ncbi:sulfur carrier protein ThiS [Mameliella alba]|uniref:Thiamine biosynthesis protein ThiS n=1 Tax=Mameliella alba TaxID=561184 RepID=A0A0B3RPW4_9RHOB|nr:sulfur carrier protein ThiS [Mameliella alba]KHQ49847.1 Thiamine biosynthesis protein ThiS [Mameliella alba]MBY6120472.1 sulfur carrier protein ThiS [Mameliella alba]OWV60582.1 thiamine biosynthesis protein ThiS [Mameliella alba]
MRIELNGDTLATGCETLAALVEERGFDADCVATALNGAFVPRGLRGQTPLAEGAKVEILSPMQGG